MLFEVFDETKELLFLGLRGPFEQEEEEEKYRGKKRDNRKAFF